MTVKPQLQFKSGARTPKNQIRNSSQSYVNKIWEVNNDKKRDNQPVNLNQVKGKVWLDFEWIKVIKALLTSTSPSTMNFLPSADW
jgi:hypothetical protein